MTDEDNNNTVKGSNPQLLVEKITRIKIYDAPYYKEFCFGLTAETIIDRAVELEYIGGTYGGLRSPCPFLCLLFRMLQITPEKEIVLEYIKDNNFKYLRALGAMYLRLTGRGMEVYQHLEPLYMDYRRLRYRHTDGSFSIIHMDEFVDSLLTERLVCDITLPFLPKRAVLEDSGELPRRQSSLEDTLEAELAQELAEENENDSRHEEEDKKRIKDKNGEESTKDYSQQYYDEKEARKKKRRRREDPNYRESYADEYAREDNEERHRHHHHKHRRHRHHDDHYHDRRHRREHERDRHDRDSRRRRQHKEKRDKKHSRDKKRTGEESMSVDETNRLRAELGLPPLKE